MGFQASGRELRIDVCGRLLEAAGVLARHRLVHERLVWPSSPLAAARGTPRGPQLPLNPPVSYMFTSASRSDNGARLSKGRAGRGR
jgi:hypothetical protein